MLVMDVARLAHEVNRAYCMATGDNSQAAWDEAPDWQRDSAKAGVLAHLADPNMTPMDSHNAWMKQKLAEGWTYGPTKDPERKLHPAILPYDHLPKQQCVKDYLFKGVVDACRNMVEPDALELAAMARMIR